MTENEAIRDLQYLIEEYSAYPPETGVSATVGSLQYCISTLKEIQQYREIGTVEEVERNARDLKRQIEHSERLAEILKATQNLLEKREILLKEYCKIGTVEERRKAVEKQTQKKCAIDSCPDHTHYKCPSCGQIELSIYKHGFPRLGRITKYCENCGQALIDEN